MNQCPACQVQELAPNIAEGFLYGVAVGTVMQKHFGEYDESSQAPGLAGLCTEHKHKYGQIVIHVASLPVVRINENNQDNKGKMTS